jgi:hypothetical protein
VSVSNNHADSSDSALNLGTAPQQPRKSFLTNIILIFTAFIRRRFKYEVKTFYIDNEPALGEKFNTWVKDNRYTVKYSALYTSGQNEAAERLKGLIITKT